MISFTFSGTGGHVYPCIALAQELGSIPFNFIGSPDRKDSEIILRHHYPFNPIPSSRKNPFIWLKSFWQARKILKKNKTKLLISAGGYLTFPVALAAKTLKIPIFLLEQNMLPGRVTKLLAPLATKIFLSFEGTDHHFPTHKTIISGNPIRKTFLEDTLYHELKKIESTFPNVPCLLFFGGSQGAEKINQLLLDNYQNFLNKNYFIFHITGEPFYKKNFKNKPFTITNVERRTSHIEQNSIIITLPYFEKMDYLYEKTDLVVCRAGATTLAELIYFKKPCILIPYPYAKDNHQLYNAQYAEKIGLGKLIIEKDLTYESLIQSIEELLLKNNNKTMTIQNNAREMIAKEIKAITAPAARAPRNLL